MDSAVNEALRALNTANLRRYTDLLCTKARRRRLKAVQRLVRVLLGDPNVVCGTNTKGEVCLSGGACTPLSGPLGGRLALTAQEHEALSMLRMAGSMHLSQRALLRMPRRCTQRDLRTNRQRIMPYFPQTTIVKSTTGRNRAAAHVPLQSIVQNAISMARVIGKPPPSGVAIVVISVDGLPCVGCSVLGRGAEPPQFWVLLIWLEPGISHVTCVHYDATMCLACFVCSILPVLHFLRFDLCVL